MSTDIFCDVEIRPARMYDDPEPAEFCEEEVEHEGDLCHKHEPEDEPEFEREDEW